ncbi:PREDICTED: uncharacterized protein LOC108568781 [Nicrophorus vespilloides]|uniref:Uncharacterized protein LOC108568781 n=1 Tax=Nicrophorus vespilloides TaxID=110193 RepID=A0ABM1NFF3_NICVS|nr:PREDICTED: uncharacterized protein LOC108568781 [Nicrophorus vespilloides]
MNRIYLKSLKKEMHLGKKFVYMTDGAYAKFVVLRRIRSSMLIRKIQLAWRRYHRRRKNAAAVICRFVRRVCAAKNARRYEKFIDLSKKSSEVCILDQEQQLLGNTKTEDFLSKHSFDLNFEGDQLSLSLEKMCSDVEVKPFKRVLFFGDRIVSFNRLAEIPVRFHLAKTCFKYSNILPRSELPYGLPDIF